MADTTTDNPTARLSLATNSTATTSKTDANMTTTTSAPGSEGKSLLMGLPLEMRHKIFGFASQRPHGPYLILKEYLEKKDPDIGPLAPPAVYNMEEEDEDNEEEEEEEEGGEDEDEDNEGEGEGDIQDGDGEGENDEAGEEEDQDEPMGESNLDEEPNTEEAAHANDGVSTATSAAAPLALANPQSDEHDEAEVETMDVDPDESGTQEIDAEEGSNEDEDTEDGNATAQPTNPPGPVAVNPAATAATTTTATVAPPAPRPPRQAPRYYGRNTKYRHILPTIQLSTAPPPLGLLQSCKQLHDEALNYHLATCVLEIDVTREFLHHSFFLETLSQFIDHPFSPIEQIRKLSLVFSWDTEWLTSKLTGSPPELDDDFAFTWFLQERAMKALDLLKAAPELRKLTIDWHDTERTERSQTLMNETIMPFLSLTGETWTDSITNESGYVDVTVTEHFSESDTVHASSSVLGRRRNEFDLILVHGMQFR
jgi:hypothetical protein